MMLKPEPSLSGAETQEIVVVGGGIAGLATALGFGRAGLRVVCLDRDTLTRSVTEDHDPRTTAIAWGSRKVLESVGGWDGLQGLGEPIRRIAIRDGASRVTLGFDHEAVGPEPFGHIFRNADLRRILVAEIQDTPTIRMLAPASLVGLKLRQGLIEATLDTGERLSTRLLVGADGRLSRVRDLAGIPLWSSPYAQAALVAEFRHEKPHHGVALEHFQPEGPFAVLPMPDRDGVAGSHFVWSNGLARSAELAALSDDAFMAALQAQLGAEWLGRVLSLGRRRMYRLHLQHARRYVGPRLALVGDAAHVMHPIAGQGLNLGLRDVALLLEQVLDHVRLGGDPGDPVMLAAWARRRRRDSWTMLGVTDGLTRLFSTRDPALTVLRRSGLAVVERMPPLKRFFMRAAMGAMPGAPGGVRVMQGLAP